MYVFRDFAGEIRRPGQRSTGVRQDGVPASPLHPVQVGRGVDHQPVQSLIRDQKIGAVANDQRICAVIFCKAHQQHQLLPAGRKCHPLCRTADAEGGVPAHRLVLKHFQIRQILFDSLIKFNRPVHSGPPYIQSPLFSLIGRFAAQICMQIHFSGQLLRGIVSIPAVTVVHGRHLYDAGQISAGPDGQRHAGHLFAQNVDKPILDPQTVIGLGMIKLCDNRERAIAITPDLLESDNRPDGFFAINDETAAGILYACKLVGLKVPDEVSICGFTDGAIAQSTDPKLTTVEQHGEEVGKNAFSILTDKLEGNEEKSTNRIVRTNLVVRGTTK